MSSRTLALLAAVTLLAAPAVAQQGPRIDILTGEPVRPRSEHPRPEPEIFNAPHAPRQEQRRAEDPPIEIYASPQMGGGTQQDPYGAGAYPTPQANPYTSRRLPPAIRRDRRFDDGYPR